MASERVLATLAKWQQQELLQELPADGSGSALLAQLLQFDAWFPGGLDNYLTTACRLSNLPVPEDGDDSSAKSQEPESAWEHWTPSVPREQDGAACTLPSLEAPLFQELESVGLAHAHACAFVVVAGGLGERLGYQDIKLKLPIETITHTSYLEAYIRHILTLQALATKTSGAAVRLPLAIMTSEATHDRTLAFLEQHAYFGMDRDQLTLLRQDKVPCLMLMDNSAQPLQLVLEPARSNAQRSLMMKPHGHGDVHTLLLQSGLAAKWRAAGARYVHFFQDTNLLILNSFLPALGATIRFDWQFTFTTVFRKAKDASGGVVQFTNPREPDDRALFNVEYHELDEFLRHRTADAFPDGDVNDPKTGYSSFPGNINHFIVAVDTYLQVLVSSGGAVPEVFNPKYADASKTKWKSPARLECMMQDFPKLLVQTLHQDGKEAAVKTGGRSPIGLVQFPPPLVYSPCKNDAVSASDKARNGIPPQCASSAEHDLFGNNCAKLQALGVAIDVSGQKPASWLDIPATWSGPQVCFDSTFAPCQSILASHFPSPAQIHLTNRSTLVVTGSSVTIHALRLDGALRIQACEGAVVEIRSLGVVNVGYEYEPVDPEHCDDPVLAMRGYRLQKKAVKELTFDAPGHYVIEE